MRPKRAARGPLPASNDVTEARNDYYIIRRPKDFTQRRFDAAPTRTSSPFAALPRPFSRPVNSMNASGAGIFADDVAADVRQAYRELIADGKTASQAMRQMLRTFRGE